MDNERRSAERHALWVPVQIQSGSDVKILAVSKDISGTGVLVIAGAELRVGEMVQVSLSLPAAAGGEETMLDAQIIRVEANDEDPEGLWRHRLALAFENPVPHLEAVLEKMIAAQQG